MISSYVSSSISTVVIVSSTSPRIMLRCWSYACTAPEHSKALYIVQQSVDHRNRHLHYNDRAVLQPLHSVYTESTALGTLATWLVVLRT